MKHLSFLSLILTFILAGCNPAEHFLTDKTYRKQVIIDFNAVKESLDNSNSKFFLVFENNLSLKEKEALMFLYAYMPLADIADYDGEFYLKQIRTAFKTKETMPWGKSIPEDVFRHFVLPPRVNNENMDSARMVFYNELKDRVKHLTIEEAALEVNHWCHEKVIYQPTCERTIGPLSAIKSAYGRCGEESTFTVTALRSVGIPARQCYTPRWAHCDDNHAWVEVWINGDWKYLGACEPEPKLNVAWFNEPVLRAMLVHTKAFGKYKGSELIDKQHEKFAYMNLISNYAPHKELVIKVLNKDQQPINGASVEFQLYNYAEYYPLSTQITNKKGLCSFTTGFGDLRIWVSKNKIYTFKKVTVEKTDTLKIVLDRLPEKKDYIEHYIPPIKRSSNISLTENEKEKNSILLKKEDSIRNSFIQTFMNKNDALALAKKLDLDNEKIWDYIQQSRGNWPNIVAYLEKGSAINREYLITQLELVSNKDLRDTEASVLINNLNFSKKLEDISLDYFKNYVLNPRVANELLWNTKPFLNNFLKENNIKSPEKLINWIKENIKINNDWNYYKVPISSKGILKTGYADSKSRNIFLVQACRTLGIPARLEPETKIPQYFYNDIWTDAIFETQNKDSRTKGEINFSLSTNIKIDPQYRIHFSISKLENGRFNTLDYGWNTPFSAIKNPFSLDVGSYMLLTGNRQSDGSVLTKTTFLAIEKDKEKNVTLEFNESHNSEDEYIPYKESFQFLDLNNQNITIDSESKKVLIWLDTNSEPSKHVLNDLDKLKKELNDTQLKFKFIFSQQSSDINFNLKDYKLPKNSSILFDNKQRELTNFINYNELENSDLPVVVLLENNMIKYYSSGYNIGIPEQLLKN